MSHLSLLGATSVNYGAGHTRMCSQIGSKPSSKAALRMPVSEERRPLFDSVRTDVLVF